MTKYYVHIIILLVSCTTKYRSSSQYFAQLLDTMLFNFQLQIIQAEDAQLAKINSMNLESTNLKIIVLLPFELPVN